MGGAYATSNISPKVFKGKMFYQFKIELLFVGGDGGSCSIGIEIVGTK